MWPAFGQVKQTKEQIPFYESQWTGERFPDGDMAPGSGRTGLSYIGLLAAGQLSDLSPGYPRFRTCLTVPLCPWIFSCSIISA